WFSVRGHTYRTIITPEVRVVAAQEFHTMNLVWGQYFTKKFLLQHLASFSLGLPVAMPSHTGGRHAHRPVATGCRSLGSASPTVPRSGRRIASAVRARGGNRDTLGGAGEIRHGA